MNEARKARLAKQRAGKAKMRAALRPPPYKTPCVLCGECRKPAKLFIRKDIRVCTVCWKLLPATQKALIAETHNRR